jgi:lipoyl(octanoyl) transferase
MSLNLIVRKFGLLDYISTWQAMKAFTDTRDEETLDEIWLLQHLPVYTQGQAGKPEHLLNPGNIPIVQTDRGGQITYHGPGQLVMYVLLDLRRLKIGIRQLVCNLEKSIIQVLANYDIEGTARCDAPGVYVDEAKICSIGLRVRHGCCYHGIAFNIDMDLEPFSGINPCGFKNLKVTQVKQLNPLAKIADIEIKIVSYLQDIFGYNQASFATDPLLTTY